MDQILVTPTGSTVKQAGSYDYVADGSVHVGAEFRSVLVTSEDDLANLTGYAPGAVAYTAGYAAMWQLSAAGSWVSIL